MEEKKAQKPCDGETVELVHADGTTVSVCMKKVKKFRLKIQWLLLLALLVFIILWWFGFEECKHFALGLAVEQGLNHLGLWSLGAGE